MVLGYILAGIFGVIIYVIMSRLKPVIDILVSVLTFAALSPVTPVFIIQTADRPLEGPRIVDPTNL